MCCRHCPRPRFHPRHLSTIRYTRQSRHVCLKIFVSKSGCLRSLWIMLWEISVNLLIECGLLVCLCVPLIFWGKIFVDIFQTNIRMVEKWILQMKSFIENCAVSCQWPIANAASNKPNVQWVGKFKSNDRKWPRQPHEREKGRKERREKKTRSIRSNWKISRARATNNSLSLFYAKKKPMAKTQRNGNTEGDTAAAHNNSYENTKRFQYRITIFKVADLKLGRDDTNTNATNIPRAYTRFVTHSTDRPDNTTAIASLYICNCITTAYTTPTSTHETHTHTHTLSSSIGFRIVDADRRQFSLIQHSANYLLHSLA